jgi:DNA-binding CsgD family transcriptional regulator
MGAELVEAARGAPDLSAWQRTALAIVAPIGFDVAFLEAKGSEPSIAMRGFDTSLVARARSRWATYEAELAPVVRAAARDGIAVDTDVLGAARERLAYFRDLVRPHRGRHSLLAPLAIGGAPAGGLMIGRTGAAFGDEERACARALIAPLSVGIAAILGAERLRAVEDEERASITPREREVLELLRLGYTNREIACALGSSPNTVRNQLASLFAKLGATTRAELVAISLHARR